MAEKKKITIHPSFGGKRVISKVSAPAPQVEPVEEVEKVENPLKVKRSCLFCQSKTTPSYTDLVTLKRFLTDRAKILPKLRSSVCARHQRALSKHIKYARHLSLLPFVPKV